MNNLSINFDKIQQIVPQERNIKKILCEAVQRLSGYPLKPSSIKVNGHFCSFSVLPMIRQEILLHKEALLGELKDNNHNIKNIF